MTVVVFLIYSDPSYAHSTDSCRHGCQAEASIVSMHRACFLTPATSDDTADDEVSVFDFPESPPSIPPILSCHLKHPHSTPTSALSSASIPSLISPSFASVEGKMTIEARNFDQLITTTIISSFVHHNRFGQSNPMTPSILIDNNDFIVCLYNCKTDVLLISDMISYANRGRLSTSGLLALWLVIHHDKSLTLPFEYNLFPSMLHQKLNEYEVFHDFSNLSDMAVDVSSIRTATIPLNSDARTVHENEPLRPGKRKLDQDHSESSAKRT